MRIFFLMALVASLLLVGCGRTEQDNEARYEERMGAISQRVDAAYPDGLVEYSAYPEDEEGLPVDALDDVAVEGPVVFVSKHDEFFGKGQDYRSARLDSPTWMEVVGAANESVKRTGDEHHIFLEGVTDTGKTEGGVRVFNLDLGS